MFKHLIPFSIVALLATHANASPILLATGSLSGLSQDYSGLNYNLENGQSASLLGGFGSGLAWAGGNTFLSVPDRGPNAVSYNAAVDNTTSYLARFHTLTLGLTAATSGALPFTLTPTLNSTTLLTSRTPLNYGTAPVPTLNTTTNAYFTGRSDAFAAGLSTNPDNARLDPEAIRVSNDGKSIYVSDEYGPYVYKFDRETGERVDTYTLPSKFAISTLAATKTAEIAGNTSGRVANKGMEGLAITPDGTKLVGFMQGGLIQDGGDTSQYNRMVVIDLATKDTKEYAYNNLIDGKKYNSSEITALNDHQFLVLERDGKGLGDGTNAAVKQVRFVDIAGAADVSNISGAANLAAKAIPTKLFLDVKSALNANGFSDANIPAKLEGLAFGEDISLTNLVYHTLYITNDNDFAAASGDNQFFVFGITDADLATFGADIVQQQISAVPLPPSIVFMFSGLVLVGFMSRKSKNI